MDHLAQISRLRPPSVDRNERHQALVEACRISGVPATAQRRAVLDAVLELDTHPTADEVFDHLIGQGVSISRATVFRTLDGLVELGLICRTCHPGRGVRFDRVTTPHHHLICLSCNAMVDFVDPSLDGLTMPEMSTSGFEITDYRVQVRGLCPQCRRRRQEDR